MSLCLGGGYNNCCPLRALPANHAFVVFLYFIYNIYVYILGGWGKRKTPHCVFYIPCVLTSEWPLRTMPNGGPIGSAIESWPPINSSWSSGVSVRSTLDTAASFSALLQKNTIPLWQADRQVDNEMIRHYLIASSASLSCWITPSSESSSTMNTFIFSVSSLLEYPILMAVSCLSPVRTQILMSA